MFLLYRHNTERSIYLTKLYEIFYRKIKCDLLRHVSKEVQKALRCRIENINRVIGSKVKTEGFIKPTVECRS